MELDLPEVDVATVSELKVMQSAAGYYVGRDYYESDWPELKMPYSRESGYFYTYEEAHDCLEVMKSEEALEGF